MSLALGDDDSVLQATRTAMIDYYTFLAGMPHFQPDCVELPPPAGWPDVDVAGLKALGRSEAAIEFMRHLPYLKPSLNCERAWITSQSPALALHRGQIWPAYLGEYVAIPPHIMYLSTAIDGKNGSDLLLDTQQGTIIENLKHGGPSDAPREERFALPETEQWKLNRTLSAKDFFVQHTTDYLHLFIIPVPPARPNWLWPTFYPRVLNTMERNEALALQDEWEAEHEVDPEYMDEDDESSSTDEDQNLGVDGEELEDLAAGDEEDKRQGLIVNGVSVHQRPPPRKLDDDTLRVYDIYKRNGWPYEQFDLDRCRTELLAFAKERDERTSRGQF